jgi:hypothetical protein
MAYYLFISSRAATIFAWPFVGDRSVAFQAGVPSGPAPIPGDILSPFAACRYVGRAILPAAAFEAVFSRGARVFGSASAG